MSSYHKNEIFGTGDEEEKKRDGSPSQKCSSTFLQQLVQEQECLPTEFKRNKLYQDEREL
jgi:hypothetical protein